MLTSHYICSENNNTHSHTHILSHLLLSHASKRSLSLGLLRCCDVGARFRWLHALTHVHTHTRTCSFVHTRVVALTLNSFRSLCSLSCRRRRRCRFTCCASLRACSLVSRRGTCLNAARSFFREPSPQKKNEKKMQAAYGSVGVAGGLDRVFFLLFWGMCAPFGDCRHRFAMSHAQGRDSATPHRPAPPA